MGGRSPRLTLWPSSSAFPPNTQGPDRDPRQRSLCQPQGPLPEGDPCTQPTPRHPCKTNSSTYILLNVLGLHGLVGVIRRVEGAKYEPGQDRKGKGEMRFSSILLGGARSHPPGHRKAAWGWVPLAYALKSSADSGCPWKPPCPAPTHFLKLVVWQHESIVWGHRGQMCGGVPLSSRDP